MFAVGNDELEKNENIAEKIHCDKCGDDHDIEYGDEVLRDGTKKKSKLLSFYKCRGELYLCGIAGKRI